LSPLKFKAEKWQMTVRRALVYLQVSINFIVFYKSLQVIANYYNALQLFAIYYNFLNNASSLFYATIKAR
jgi:hypothetical protein